MSVVAEEVRDDERFPSSWRRQDRSCLAALPVMEWQDTRDTLHMWSQVVGKIRMALATATNHWWHTTLYVSARFDHIADPGRSGTRIRGRVRPA